MVTVLTMKQAHMQPVPEGETFYQPTAYVRHVDYEKLERENKKLKQDLDAAMFIINSDEKPKIRELELKIQCLEGQLAVAKDEKLKAERDRRDMEKALKQTNYEKTCILQGAQRAREEILNSCSQAGAWAGK